MASRAMPGYSTAIMRTIRTTRACSCSRQRAGSVGSASGTLNAIQQLGNSIGVAVLATIFFSLLDHGHTSSTAMTRTALISAGIFVAAFALSFLLPKEARMEEF